MKYEIKKLQDLDAKEMYSLRVDHSRSKSVDKYSVFIFCFEHSHNAVSKMCRLEFRFHNLPFSKLPANNVPFSYEQEAHPSHFSPF